MKKNPKRGRFSYVSVRKNPRNPRRGTVSVWDCLIFGAARVFETLAKPSQPSQKSRLFGGRGRYLTVWARRETLAKLCFARRRTSAHAGAPRERTQCEGYAPPSAPDPGLRGQFSGRPLSTSVVVLIILDAAVFALDLLPRQRSRARNGLCPHQDGVGYR